MSAIVIGRRSISIRKCALKVATNRREFQQTDTAKMDVRALYTKAGEGAAAWVFTQTRIRCAPAINASSNRVSSN